MGYDVNIKRLGLSAVIDLQGAPESIRGWCKADFPSLPKNPNTAEEKDGISLYWIGYGRWLLRSPIDREVQLLEMARPEAAPMDISVVQVSDTLCFFEIVGPEAGEVISIACPMDHHPTVFPHNGVSYTSIFGVKGLLIRIDTGFEIAIESSHGDMIADCLQRANS